MPKKENIAVLGGGSWGSTLATYLAGKGHNVSLWEYDARIAEKLDKERCLETVPDLRVAPSIDVTHNIEDAVKGKNVIFSVVPSHHVRDTFVAAKKSLSRGAMVVSASKGLEVETHLTMSQVIREVFSEAGDIVILSGPSHAEEVAQGHPVALVAASPARAASKKVQDMMSSESFRVYSSEDALGVELGASLKNIYAVACGVVDGINLGDSTKAALMTRALAEMTRLGIKMDTSPLTYFGLAGLGDLIVTCQSPFSRNRKVGELIGRGNTLEQALEQMTMVAEGVNSTKSAFQLAKEKGVETPIINEMAKVLFDNKSPKDSIRDLMMRQVGTEMEGIVL